ncbi:hypothetical protein CYMTET_8863 [Cymbomonas tetramitiformis]|uniref:Uncharacterized protein n=1 Tax=Cymbomonas tetramitiformis TaxID=36881 RepID=A0AAE0LFP5_9CHLO|nr:hypothetical protein CYMTET_8863 [Cymbomonas tetramitiformis]
MTSEERKRAAAKARFGSLRTATDEELRRALDGTLSFKDITRPSGESTVLARPILPAGGALIKGMDIRVARPRGDVEEGGAELRLDAKRGLVLECNSRRVRASRSTLRPGMIGRTQARPQVLHVQRCGTRAIRGPLVHGAGGRPGVMGIAVEPGGGQVSGGNGRWQWGAGCAKRKIVAEPEAERTEDAAIDSDDREPEPAGAREEMQAEVAEPWWARLRRLLVTSVCDATGAQLPAAAGTALAVLLAGPRGLTSTGTIEEERVRFQQEVRNVGVLVPLMSGRAHLMAEALKDWPGVPFLARGTAACGVGFPFAGTKPDDPYVVENYVGEERTRTS